MKHKLCAAIVSLAWLGLLATAGLAATTNVHTTWLWHLHQPIYWPDRRDYGVDHYENAWDTIQQQNAGRPDPNPEVLSTIFSDADRVNVYQGEIESVLGGLLEYPNAGAQVNYSGALIENVQSLAAAGQLGYGNGWNGSFQTARQWTTSSGKPRLDLVNFTYHHAIAPLLDAQTLQMDLLIHQRQMQIFWGTNVPLSRGYFPAETCFSEHIIPALNKMGITWVVVANNHLSRTCPDMPIVTGSGGEMCDLPNPADQINPAQGPGNYQRISIQRGCSPTQVMPFGFQTHYVRYVDPSTGAASEVILVPSDQVFGWMDSYSTWDLGQISPIAARNNPARPALVLCAHDGDNAWSGGYSYYNQWVPQMAATAAGDGYEPTTIEQFIADFPPPTNDIVHVEDGGWVFADSDFGSPSFINWNWPPSHAGANGQNIVDPSVGVTSKGDNWRVILATENRVETAQQISGLTPVTDQVRDPGSFSGTPGPIDLGWHYCLGSLDSGFVYYGCTGDECLRAIVAQSNACRNVDPVIAANPNADTTPPTVFLPQRHPWNPGGANYGVQYGYALTAATNSDFWVWTYAYDASGLTNVSLFLRQDGTNPPLSDQCKTYAGGPLTGPWQAIGMTRRVATNSSGYTPEYQADYYYSYVTGISNAFVDYYISATDSHGNTSKTPLQHVWVAAVSGGNGGSGNGNGCNGRVCVSPADPGAGAAVTIDYNPAGGPIAAATTVDIHLGWNGWNPVVSPDAAMTYLAASNLWQYTVVIPNDTTQLNCVFNNGSGTWDNNSGANWNFSVAVNTNPAPPAPPLNLTAAPVRTNEINLSWSAAAGATSYIIDRNNEPVAATAATNYADTGLTADTAYCYSVMASNSVGYSPPSPTVCTNTPAVTAPPFVLSGAFAYPGYLLASNSMVLYAAVRGTVLYVATDSPGANGPNDCFIFVSDQLSAAATNPAPWAKSGLVAVAPAKPYLAAESQNTYLSWYVNNTEVTNPCAKSPATSGALEGTIDLLATFGYMPANLYLCAAAYVTTNGGPLVAECPAGSGLNLNPSNFLEIPTAALADSNGSGTFDRLDPARGFVLLGATLGNGSNIILNWASMPGHTYQVVFRNALVSPWSNLTGATSLAGPLQLFLSSTNPVSTNPASCFYGIKLTH